MSSTNSRQQRLDAIKQEACRNYAHTWQLMVSAWQKDSRENVGWLMYAANYLFRTHNIRWAIDPFLLTSRISAPPLDHPAADLEKLNFILLTHRHADHFDNELIRLLKDFPILWVVPLDMQKTVIELGINKDAVITPQPGKPIDLCGIQVTPFSALHYHIEANGVQYGVPECGYFVETKEKRLLFPGDTRDYKVEKLPKFTQVDVAFAHTWLGKKCADMEIPPLVEEFAQFFCSIEPTQLVVTHLFEFKRPSIDQWDELHFQLIKNKLKEISPILKVDMRIMGESFSF